MIWDTEGSEWLSPVLWPAGGAGCWEGALGGSHIVVGAEAASYLFGLLFPSLLLGEEL